MYILLTNHLNKEEPCPRKSTWDSLAVKVDASPVIPSREIISRSKVVNCSDDILLPTPQCGIESVFSRFFHTTVDPRGLYYVSSDSDDDTAATVFDPQSGLQSSSETTSGTSQNISFSENIPHQTVSVESVMDPSRKAQDLDTTPLDKFFERPIKIYSKDWVVGTPFLDLINPWTLFFDNPRVAARIANYNLLRCKLNLKIVINGNAFHYGRILAAYQPHYALDFVTPILGPGPAAMTQLSQLPHVFLNPTTSTGGDMELPFFNYANYIEVPENEWEVMGSLWVTSLNTLRHANGGVDGCTISIFAWASEVNLSVLTAFEPQAGTETDEANSKGFISGPATAVAGLASKLAAFPPIAPYMVATANIASATSALAKTMGYSRPVTTADPTPFKPKAFSDLAVTTTPDGAAKLTVDDQQELSIDPRIAGLGSEDPLNIVGIASRESYITTFDWLIATPVESLLFNISVDPITWNPDGAALYLPACAVTAMPFKYWTGTLNYRFQIVSSGFHKGRLKFVYDPKGTLLGNDEYNVNHIHIVDISESTDFSLSISNGQRVTWLEHLIPGVDPITSSYGTAPISSPTTGNGTLAVYVVNDLTTPDTSAAHDISINVFVSAGDDFEVTVPSEEICKYVFKPQSGVEESNAPDDNMDMVEQTETVTLGPTYDLTDNMGLVYMGETIKSLRPLLKRYVLHEAFGPLATGDKVIRGVRNMLPYYRGGVPGAVHLSGLVPYSFCNTLLVHWVIMAHSGWRGSMRYKITPRGAALADKHRTVQVERRSVDGTFPSYSQDELSWDFYTTQPDAARAAVIGSFGVGPYFRQSQIGALGAARTMHEVNENMEFEVPFYSNFRYVPGRLLDVTSTSSGFQPPEAFEFKIYTNGGTTTLYEKYAAVGEDFQVYFWSGLPAIYRENVPPPL